MHLTETDDVKRYYGIYRAVVKDTKDPLNVRRIKVIVPQVTGNEVTDWVWPIHGTENPPPIGKGVFISYLGGDPEYPLWLGKFGAGTGNGGGGGGGTNPPGIFAYGAWHSTATQSASVNTPTLVTVNTKDYESDIAVVNNTKFQVTYPGVYNIQFSFQFHGLSGGGSGTTTQIWFAKNGTTIPQSNTKVTVNNNSPYIVAAWNFFQQLNANDYLQMYWQTDNTQIKIEASSASSTPAIPSVIVTMNQIA